MNDLDYFIGLFAVAGMTGFILGISMMFVTKHYLNHSSRRRRYIELIWGPDNEWHNGKRFDFVIANFIIPGSTFTAWRMKIGLMTRHQKAMGAHAYPALHMNSNYIKLLEEFRFFVRWECSKGLILVLSLGLVVAGMGLDKGWW